MISSSIIKGKNCFISGATGGLGKSIATELVLNQCNLFLTSTKKTKLKKLKKETICSKLRYYNQL